MIFLFSEGPLAPEQAMGDHQDTMIMMSQPVNTGMM